MCPQRSAAQSAGDRRMALMQATCRGQALIEAPEDHGMHGREGAMESPDRIGKTLRVLLDCSSDPGMRQLKEERAPGSQKDCRLPADLPGYGLWTEQTRSRTRGVRRGFLERTFQIFRADNLHVSLSLTIVRRADYALG